MAFGMAFGMPYYMPFAAAAGPTTAYLSHSIAHIGLAAPTIV